MTDSSSSPATRPRVLITGARGAIGRTYAAHAAERFDLALLCRHDDERAADLYALGDVVVGDLNDPDTLARACAGAQAVVHLAANPDESSDWDALMDANVTGTLNLYRAAEAAGVKRVVFASSIHAVTGYPTDHQVRPDDPVNPGDPYGVTKCFGEALARYFAEQRGLRGIAVRIGWCRHPDELRGNSGLKTVDCFVSFDDLHRLLDRCVETPDAGLPPFTIVHGVSDNRWQRMGLDATRRALNYRPTDRVWDLHPDLAPLDLPRKILTHSERGHDGDAGLG